MAAGPSSVSFAPGLHSLPRKGKEPIQLGHAETTSLDDAGTSLDDAFSLALAKQLDEEDARARQMQEDVDAALAAAIMAAEQRAAARGPLRRSGDDPEPFGEPQSLAPRVCSTSSVRGDTRWTATARGGPPLECNARAGSSSNDEPFGEPESDGPSTMRCGHAVNALSRGPNTNYSNTHRYNVQDPSLTMADLTAFAAAAAPMVERVSKLTTRALSFTRGDKRFHEGPCRVSWCARPAPTALCLGAPLLSPA